MEHPTFKKMIDIAARAQDGVEIPLRKVAHEELLDMFRQRMSNLKATLNVSIPILCESIDMN